MIPKDIKSVVERLILKGAIKRPAWKGLGSKDVVNDQMILDKRCRLCGKFASRGKAHECPKAILLALLLFLPMICLGQSKTNVPVIILDARITFIQPIGKEAHIYTRKSLKDSWKFWQMIPKNTLPVEQGVILALPEPIAATTQCQVVFK